ncbi:MAG: hypothetical protein HC821_04760, partial [Lewinella sp.]|nr:hypothetical protein [Lewinella sp.]
MDTYAVKGKNTPEKISNADYALLAPNLLLKVEDHGIQARAVRSEGLEVLSDTVWNNALAANEVRLLREFKMELEGASGGQAVHRSDGALVFAQEQALQLLTPNKAALQTAVLHEDEYGELRWVLPRASSSGEQQIFDLPPVPAGPAHRGEITKTIRRVVKVSS